MSVISFEQLSREFRQYLTQRAGNYDYMTARDVFNELPPELMHDEKLMINYMRGNETLGVEPHELMHHVSEANGGLDTPENISFGPRSLNREIGANDMTDADFETLEVANERAVDILLDADPIDLVELGTDTAMGIIATSDVPDLTDLGDIHEGPVAPLDSPITQLEPEIPDVLPAEASPEILTDAAEAGESLVTDALGLVAETAVAGIAAYKTASYVHENLPADWSNDDKTLASLGAGGGMALLAFTPVGQAAIGVYAGYKLLQFGGKLIGKLASE